MKWFPNNKIIKKFSNYNEYALCGWNGGATEVEEARLLNLIAACQRMLKKPYIRFILTNDNKAKCFIYEGDERVTRLVPVSEIEQMVADGAFHK